MAKNFKVQNGPSFAKLYPEALNDGMYTVIGNGSGVNSLALTEKQKALTKLQDKLGRSIHSINLSEMIREDTRGNPVEKPILENLNLSQGGLGTLLKTKVESLIIEGATYQSGWETLVNQHDMSETEKLDVTSMKDYKVHKGYVEGSERRDSGGDYSKISLDVSTPDTIRFMEIPIKETDIQFKKWNYMETTLRQSGAAMGHDVLTNVIVGLAANVASGTETFSTKLYNTIVNARKTQREAGFPPGAVIVSPTDEATLLKDSDFLDANKLDRTGEIVRTGQIGRILDMAVFAPLTETVGTDLSGVFLVTDITKAAHIGMARPLTIANWDEPLRGLTHAILTMHYDDAYLANASKKGANA